MNYLPLSKIKEALRNGPYAWPGGYPVHFIMGDGEIASFDGLRSEWARICRAYLSPIAEPEWLVLGTDIYWEGPDLECCISNAPIPSAYGPLDDA